MMRKKAFTLIELLVVIAIISLLMALLVPALAKARQLGRGILCTSNLRQMNITAQIYTDNNDEYFPMAFMTKVNTKSGEVKTCEWDFITEVNSGEVKTKPGLLWQGETIAGIHQCPSFKGKNWQNDPYSGYNYNRSYIGGNAVVIDNTLIKNSIKMSTSRITIKKPKDCPIFGDGEYADGPNKFMRSPFSGKLDKHFSARYAGTQGYRHLSKTNVAYCDGSVRSVRKLYTKTINEMGENKIKQHNELDPDKKVGFLSPDNSAYDLK